MPAMWEVEARRNDRGGGWGGEARQGAAVDGGGAAAEGGGRRAVDRGARAEPARGPPRVRACICERLSYPLRHGSGPRHPGEGLLVYRRVCVLTSPARAARGVRDRSKHLLTHPPICREAIVTYPPIGILSKSVFSRLSVFSYCLSGNNWKQATAARYVTQIKGDARHVWSGHFTT